MVKASTCVVRMRPKPKVLRPEMVKAVDPSPHLGQRKQNRVANYLTPQVESHPFDDPPYFVKLFWPKIKLYDKQIDILYSVRDNDETQCPAGNMLGKDFIAGLAVIWFFCSRVPARVVTTSVDGSQLEGVLWGEIRRFLQEHEKPVVTMSGRKVQLTLGIEENHLHLRKILSNGKRCPRSEVVAKVAKKGEGMLGRHIESTDGRPRTLVVFDEASGNEDVSYESADTWAKRKLIIGNPYECTNFFKKGVKGGDIPKPGSPHFWRKVIKIKAEDSPNVRLALRQIALGKTPTGEILIPGLLDYPEYLKRRALWDKVRQCIGLDAEFYEGAEVLLYPPSWLALSTRYARSLSKGRKAVSMGVDVAEGGDSSVWTIVDMKGVLYQLSLKTPDTTVIVTQTQALMKEFGLAATNVYFDRGGGGYQHVKVLEKKGLKVQLVGFGESASDPDHFKRMRSSLQKTKEQHRRLAYKNRRAEMYGLVREMLDPSLNPDGFGIPEEYQELLRQMSPIPLWYDEEGRLMLPQKRNKPGTTAATAKPCLIDIIGCSPDEADSLALAVFGLFNVGKKITARVPF